MQNSTHLGTDFDVILVGAGIMSANLGAILRCIEPSLGIQVYEVAAEMAQESSNGWNNAGTGHAGLCELSYTPHREKTGGVDVTKAIEIFAQFERSKQFWSYAIASGMVGNPKDFIRRVPHLSFVSGTAQVDFLRARFEALSAHPFFSSMEFTTDRATLARWAPLLAEGRDPREQVAATKMENGTDVDFGALARHLLQWLSQQDRCGIALSHRVVGLRKISMGWEVTAKNLTTGEVHSSRAKFVFIGAGGGSLPLLQQSGIPEAKGLGGFPIGGQWLVCDNPAIVQRHQAKVYGQALESAPTMAVPHLDSRVLDGRKALLFGPFAAWTTKFLHRHGSPLDLFRSISSDNIATLLQIGMHNVPLVRYLMQQGTQTMADRLAVLRAFYPLAQAKDWNLVNAGIRVQAIKKTDGNAGIVHYGTEVITNRDRSLAALLGASPGASVSVDIILEIIKACFPRLVASPPGLARIEQIVPTWARDITRISEAADYCERKMPQVDDTLQIGVAAPGLELRKPAA
jgi:malate dehydrogenase (quinone)